MDRLLIIAITFFFCSCKPAENDKTRFAKWAQKGQIIDKVVCKNASNYNYCLYLPSNYSPDKSWPIVYAFDSHGDGKLPVSILKNTAEKLGYITAGSNNSKNGLNPDEINFIVSALLEDTKNKLNINLQRIYTVGFSGGARVACSTALSYPDIKGVIACSAGFKPDASQRPFHFIGIVGNEDMNYMEMKHLESILIDWRTFHQLLVFNGKHRWPDERVLSKALVTLEIYAMKDGFANKNDSFIQNYLNNSKDEMNELMKTDNVESKAQALQLLQNTAYTLNGLTDLSDIQRKIAELQQSQSLQSYQKKEEKIESDELTKEQEIADAYAKQPIEYWKEKINGLVKISQHGNDSLEKRSASRILAYISLISFSYVNNTISQQNWQAASHFLEIYGMADPSNSDYHYFKACYLANNSKSNEAMTELKKAIDFGFNDNKKLQYDPLLNTLRNQPEFNEIVGQVKKAPTFATHKNQDGI